MKTVKVRIALFLDGKGGYCTAGWGMAGRPSVTDNELRGVAIEGLDADAAASYWIETEVAIPEPQTIQAEARPA